MKTTWSFIKWMFAKISTEVRILISAILLCILYVAIAIQMGVSALVILVVIICAIFGTLLGMFILGMLLDQWEKYKKEKEAEEQAVLDKLSGRRRYTRP